MQGERLNVDSSVAEKNNVVKLTTLFFRNASERSGISMYMTNEEWEQNNQDYLKESYEETGFTAGGYAVRKLICGGCGRVFYTTIEDTKKWVLSPERKAPKATREYASHRLDTVLDKFLKTMQTTAARLQEKLLKPEARQKGKEQVKEKARDSVLQLLSRLQAEQMQRKPGDIPAAEKSENRFQ